ncbi:MAG TPA: hybrid sensor histidine kinase/response regulator [Longimicrobiaceae bacterium]|nr:hybrid sensor histidine kinase/response regulator [Longimicrobiaceae bacterium]
MTAPPGTAEFVVLLVEDNPADAELIALRLESAGSAGEPPVRLLHAGSTAEACAALRETPVDMVILDLSLPDASWPGAFHRVRAEAPEVPVIVLTGTDDEAVALRALRAGAQDYVLKPPPDGATLRRILRYAGERHRLLRELDAAMHAQETAARRWRLLAEAACVLAATDDPAAAVRKVARLVVPAEADCFVLLFSGGDAVAGVAEAEHVDRRLGAALRRRVRHLLDPPAGTSAPLLAALDGPEPNDDVLRPLLGSLAMASGSAVPVHTGGPGRGVVVLACGAARADGAQADEFARSLADRLSVALERVRLLRRAERAVAARDRAFGIVSHDLRNPLGTIQVCAAALLDLEPQPAEGMRNMARIIQRSADWMQQIVRDLLDRASLDAGRLALERRPTAVSDVVGAVQVMFVVAAEEEIELAVECEEGLPEIDADPGRLLQVLANLLSNALKFTPAGGRVALRVRTAAAEEGNGGADAVCFVVSDTGPGIPPEDLPHVFDWFWQSDRTRRGGAGLGLAIARGLIEAHGSRLHVESAPGKGSTFWFTLAAVPAAPEPTTIG